MAKKILKKNNNLRVYVGVALIVLSTFCFIPLFTGLISPVKSFLMGVLGVFAYPISILTFVIGLALINHKKYVLPARYIVFITCALISLLAVIQMAVLNNFKGGFFEFLGECYAKKLTPGGIVVGIFLAPIKFALNNIGAYVVFSILFIVFTWLIIDYLVYIKKNAEKGKVVKVVKKKDEAKEKSRVEVQKSKKDWIIDGNGNLVVEDEEKTKLEQASEKRNLEEKPKITLDAKIENENKESPTVISARDKLGLNKNGVIATSSNIEPKNETPLQKKVEKEEMSRRDYILTPPNFMDLVAYSRSKDATVNDNSYQSYGSYNNYNASSYNDNYSSFNNFIGNSNFNSEINSTINSIKNEGNQINEPERVLHEESGFVLNRDNNEESYNYESEPMQEISNEENEANKHNFVNLDDEQEEKEVVSTEKASEIISKIFDDNEKTISVKADEIKTKPVQLEIQGAEKKSQVETPKNYYKKPPKYVRPPIDLLQTISSDNFDMQVVVQQNAQKLEESLQNFNIPAKVVNVVIGPAVTRYELEMPAGISVKKILAHQDDIAYSIASNGNIRIEAPIPGRSAVGIEVPNSKIATVGLKEIIASKEFNEAKAPLTFALGKDINGDIRLCNLAKMPHLLVAGATGSGKSVCLNSVIISLIYKTSPEDLRLILIDPKRVEFSVYDGLPHLLQPRIISDIDKAINALNWSIAEMERRFGLFQEVKARNLEEYNMSQKVLSGESEKLPLIVIIIDELADFMIQAKKDLEDKIARLAAKARACGIHLILATQRPSVNVITGIIKANFPSRIAFAVMSYVDSKTIIDSAGAEKLLGKGDMLYFPQDRPEPTRIQGCFVSTKEVEQVVEFVKANNPAEYDSEIAKTLTAPSKQTILAESSESGYDELMPQALKYIIENGQASITMIQRKFVVGYPRAARILDQMVEAGYVSGADGSKPRSVYITMEQWEKLFGENEN